ncbi:entericidin A/B family lipoprotein [Roseovarius sp. A-2]|nr:entericidin A/B family lipoprotein [Roseovarius sp. A-2]
MGVESGERATKWVIIGLMACTGLAACETVQGAGRDLQNAGQAMEQAVE